MNLKYRLRTRAVPWLTRKARRAGSVIWRALIKYDETDGEQRAASFAYYAFFALFPLVILLITIFTAFLRNRDEAILRITSAVSEYLAVGEESSKQLIATVDGVVRTRGSAGLIAFAVLAWSAISTKAEATNSTVSKP